MGERLASRDGAALRGVPGFLGTGDVSRPTPYAELKARRDERREKRRASNSTMPASDRPMNKVSENRPQEIIRSMGTPERRRFVASLPCAACGVVGFSVSAHLLGNDGRGRKKDCTTTGPLCRSRTGVEGCHDLRDTKPWEFTRRYPDFNPVDVAEETQRKFLEHQNA